MLAVIVLPWPSKALHPNARVHRMALARARKAARHDGWAAALSGTTPTLRDRLKAADAIPLAVTFFPPDRRRRDDDGMVSSIKSHRDGIADALGVDDSHFRPTYAIAAPEKPGRVEVVIKEIAS